MIGRVMFFVWSWNWSLLFESQIANPHNYYNILLLQTTKNNAFNNQVVPINHISSSVFLCTLKNISFIQTFSWEQP